MFSPGLIDKKFTIPIEHWNKQLFLTLMNRCVTQNGVDNDLHRWVIYRMSIKVIPFFIKGESKDIKLKCSLIEVIAMNQVLLKLPIPSSEVELDNYRNNLLFHLDKIM